MAKQVQHRRGTTAQHTTFTGAVGEITVDTDKDTAVIHDGATAGGFPLAKASELVPLVSEAELSASSGSSLVGHIQTGTGAATRTLQSKLREQVSVTDFGAVGDGSVNDTTAVQNAFNSGADAIYFPDGVYSVGQITVPNGVRKVFGPGRIQQRAIGANVFYLSGVTNCVFDGLYINGAANLNEAVAQSVNSGIFCTSNCSYIVVSNCTINRFLYVPVYMEQSYDSRVVSCSFTENSLGPRFRGCRRIIIDGNEIYRTCLVNTQFTTGIGLDSTDGHALGICVDIIISNNITVDINNAQGMLIHAGANIVITGNTVKESATGISINPFNSGDILANITVSNNVINAFSGTWVFGGISNDCIVVQGGTGTPDPLSINVTNNVCINGNYSHQGANEGAIRLGYTVNCSVIGNIITTPYGNGIVLTADEQHVIVSNNSIYNTQTAAGDRNGVLIITGGVSGIISNNYFENAINGIEVGGSSLNMFINNNQYSGCTNTVVGATLLGERSITHTTGSTIALGDVDSVYFNYSAPTTITTFTDVIPGKIYVFRNAGSNQITINRTNAYLDGGVNLVLPNQYDVAVMLGIDSNDIIQLTGRVLNS